MEKISFKLLLFIFLVFASIIIFVQYKIYRTPFVETTEEIAIETDEVKHSIPLNEIVSAGIVKNGIPSIDKPIFESVASADKYLDNEGFGIALEINDRTRYYPYQVLVWHEIVNDVFQTKKLAITYSPLTYSGKVFDREFNDQIFEFGTSGELYNSNLLMYDRTYDSLWSQVLGKAVKGPLTGMTLKAIPSNIISWNNFKKNFPHGEVLSRKTGEVRDYTRNPYGNYLSNNSILFPVNHKDSRMDSKTIVFGLKDESGTKAFALNDIEKAKIINDVVGGRSILILWDQDLNTATAFLREIDGRQPNISLENNILKDSDGSKWNASGKAISGPNSGFQLKAISLENTLWFSWVSSYPETEVYELP